MFNNTPLLLFCYSGGFFLLFLCLPCEISWSELPSGYFGYRSKREMMDTSIARQPLRPCKLLGYQIRTACRRKAVLLRICVNRHIVSYHCDYPTGRYSCVNRIATHCDYQAGPYASGRSALIGEVISHNVGFSRYIIDRVP